ncbi:MAG: hypothetical protein IMF16_05160 [Proteobacteria bacterium]|nr:hypothetical protein [Pseudomonadota bacterium]
MRRLLLMLMLTALLIALVPTLAAAGLGGGAGLTSRVTIQLDGESAPAAFRLLFSDRPESYVFQGEPTNEQAQRLLLTLNNVEFESALRIICDAAELDYRVTDGVWVFSPRPAAAYLHGARIPVLGSVQVSRGGGGGGGTAGEADLGAGRATTEEILTLLSRGPSVEEARTLLSRVRSTTDSTVNWPSARLSPQLPPGLGNIIIDLEVTEATLEEVAARLSDVAGPEVEVRVHPAVAPTFRVTASVYRMPFPQVLSLLVERAGLTFGWEPIPVTGRAPHDDTEADLGQPRRFLADYLVWIVPTPTLSITGRPNAGGFGRMADPNRPAETPGAPGS